jgi:phosphoribosyl 1,2-cyclic phosphate phosphodiesterase
MLSLQKIDAQTPFKVAEADDLEVLPILVWHGRMSILGFRVGDLAYITDCKTLDESEIEKLKNLNLLIINALHHEEHIAHLNLKEAIELAQKIGAKMTYLTHMSHKMGKYAVLNPTLPSNIRLSYDGLTLSF